MLKTLVMLLAGGRGTRLNILAAHRAKPAVPFAGMYRIIDFTLSNCMHARLNVVGVLTQYRPLSLMNHVSNGCHWDLAGKNATLKILPPYQAAGDFDWYRGTADAVYQNINFIWRYKPERVLILSGDHIYRMDYARMIEAHRERSADLTIAAMPVPQEETSRFGIIVDDGQGNVVDFQEKPKAARSNLASMGIYVFETATLLDELHRLHAEGKTDFGADMIPGMLASGRYRIGAYRFGGYWRDVGTIDSYFDANMDALRRETGIDLRGWKVRTNIAYESVFAMPPARIEAGAAVRDSLVSPGCVIQGTVERSILSPGVHVGKGAFVADSIVMHRSEVKEGARVVRAVIDKRCTVGAGVQVGSYAKAAANRMFPTHLTGGLVVIGKGGSVPDGMKVGSNVIIQSHVSASQFNDACIPDGETVTAGPPAAA